jgi:hypothetical protein
MQNRNLLLAIGRARPRRLGAVRSFSRKSNIVKREWQRPYSLEAGACDAAPRAVDAGHLRPTLRDDGSIWDGNYHPLYLVQSAGRFAPQSFGTGHSAQCQDLGV